MDVTININIIDAITLKAILHTRAKSTKRQIVMCAERGETAPEFLYDDLEDDRRLLEIVSNAIEQARLEERERVDALVKQVRK